MFFCSEGCHGSAYLVGKIPHLCWYRGGVGRRVHIFGVTETFESSSGGCGYCVSLSHMEVQEPYYLQQQGAKRDEIVNLVQFLAFSLIKHRSKFGECLLGVVD
ncbi:hypothetical protein L6452_17535 [Arctium lappa]|uniref:Uncharacterized protein n=1 Tax=Arctium lappa TaxID=4217 RepID=A0ACB9C3T9_ARCLA|nr:hypothetical protein L6452_17535 [Arctium lappa]